MPRLPRPLTEVARLPAAPMELMPEVETELNRLWFMNFFIQSPFQNNQAQLHEELRHACDELVAGQIQYTTTINLVKHLN